ncbi:glycosyltransferase, partial [Levilactobacillus namurensis]|uniref:glycosyltransferase n=1 Tax=Levilactobacillus namurensis TaxID=380393 RepID=UPI0022303D77
MLNSQNLGMIPNFCKTLAACRGEYIALLEGDDYWTDTGKLQKQVDLLDRHRDCVICHHNAMRTTPAEPQLTLVWKTGARKNRLSMP